MTNATSQKWSGEQTLERKRKYVVFTEKRFVISITCSFCQPIKDFQLDQNFRSY